MCKVENIKVISLILEIVQDSKCKIASIFKEQDFRNHWKNKMCSQFLSEMENTLIYNDFSGTIRHAPV